MSSIRAASVGSTAFATVNSPPIGTAQNFVIPTPTGLTPGNLLVIMVVNRIPGQANSNITRTLPPGWSTTSGDWFGPQYHSVFLAYKYVDNTEPSSYTFAVTPTAAGVTSISTAATIMEVVDPPGYGQPLIPNSPNILNSTQTTAAATTITTPDQSLSLGANSLIVDFVSGDSGGTVSTITQSGTNTPMTLVGQAAGATTSISVWGVTDLTQTTYFQRTLNLSASQPAVTGTFQVGPYAGVAPALAGSSGAAPGSSSLAPTSMTINWNPANYAKTWELWRYVTSAGAGTAVKIFTSPILINYNDTGLAQSTGYTYYVVSINPTGAFTSATYAVSTPAHIAPLAPSALHAYASYRGYVRLDWTDASTLGNAATSYQVFRYVTSAGAGTAVLVETTAVLSHKSRSLVDSTDYSYYVIGVNDVGAGPASTTKARTTLGTAIAVVGQYSVFQATTATTFVQTPSSLLVPTSGLQEGDVMVALCESTSNVPSHFQGNAFNGQYLSSLGESGGLSPNVFVEVMARLVTGADMAGSGIQDSYVWQTPTTASSTLSVVVVVLRGVSPEQMFDGSIVTLVSAASTTWTAPALTTTKAGDLLIDYIASTGATASADTGMTMGTVAPTTTNGSSSFGRQTVAAAGTVAARTVTMSASSTGTIVTFALQYAATEATQLPTNPSPPYILASTARSVTIAWKEQGPANGLPAYYELMRFDPSNSTTGLVAVVASGTGQLQYVDSDSVSSLTATAAYIYSLVPKTRAETWGGVVAGPSSVTVTRPLATALTAYLSANLSSVSTARQLLDVNPGGANSLITTVAKNTGYIELRSVTATTVFTVGTPTAATPAPSANGWLYDVTLLEQKSIAAGTWTPNIEVSCSSTLVTAAFYVRVYKRSSGGVYTSIGFFTSAAATISTTAGVSRVLNNFTGNTGVPAMAFAVGDKLYLDVFCNITANTSGTTATTVTCFRGGGTIHAVVTPGYAAPAAVAPNAPTIGTAAPNGQGVLRVTWTDSTTGTSPTYIVQHSVDNLTWVNVATSIAAATQLYDDAGLPGGTLYYERVQSRNVSGYATSAVVSATTLAAVGAGLLLGLRYVGKFH